MKKCFIIIIFLCEFSLSYSQEPTITYFNKDWEETIKDSAMYYRVGENNFGVSDGAISDYYMSGELQMTGSYMQFAKHGEFIWYYKNGNKKEEGTYNYGKYTIRNKWNDQQEKVIKNGTGLSTWYYENGMKKSQVNYENGNKQGTFSYWDREGKLYEEDSCVKGDCWVINFWDKQGNKTINNGNGKYITYYSNGIKKATGWYKNGKKMGKWIWYHENGIVQTSGEYDKNESRKGEWLWKYNNENKCSLGFYTDGFLDGIYSTWYPDGKLKEYQEYKNGTPIGKRKIFYKDGSEKIF